MAYSPSLAARLARPVQALALGMCVCSAALVLLSGYALLRPDPTRDPAASLPNFLRPLTRVEPAAAAFARDGGSRLPVQLHDCACSEPASDAPQRAHERRRAQRRQELQV